MRLLDLGRILPLAALSLLTPFCASEQNDTNSSESHFLDSCDGDAACPSSMRCLCGVCTKECDADADCSHLSASAVCEHDANSCETAVCRAPRSSAADGAADSTCGQLSRKIQAAIDAAVASESKACTTSADCASTTLANSCHGGCYVFANKSSIAATEAARDQAEADFCPDFQAAGCRSEEIIPCPGPPQLSCRNGQCVAGATMACPNRSCGASCDDLTGQIVDRLDAAMTNADKTCTKDADCATTGRDTSCYHSCETAALSTAGIATVKAALDGIERDLCPSFSGAGCQAVIPPCVAPLPSRCDNGTCRSELPSTDERSCGGLHGDTCPSHEYCAYTAGLLCGANDSSALCKQRPATCDPIEAPVCGCDGNTYANDCEAARAGTGVMTTGACK